MSSANSVSDLERAEHSSAVLAKRVSTVNTDGTQINPATEETLQAVLAASGGSTYNFIQSEDAGTYKYYGYTDGTNWKIKRKTIATGVWKVADGTGDYDTAWAARSSQTYNYV